MAYRLALPPTPSLAQRRVCGDVPRRPLVPRGPESEGTQAPLIQQLAWGLEPEGFNARPTFDSGDRVTTRGAGSVALVRVFSQGRSRLVPVINTGLGDRDLAVLGQPGGVSGEAARLALKQQESEGTLPAGESIATQTYGTPDGFAENALIQQQNADYAARQQAGVEAILQQEQTQVPVYTPPEGYTPPPDAGGIGNADAGNFVGGIFGPGGSGVSGGFDPDFLGGIFGGSFGI